MKTLITNAKVWKGKNTFLDSIGFDSETGKITFTGTKAQITDLKKDYEEIIDLKGKLVLPAFTDGHIHFIEGSFENSQLDLRNARTKNDFIYAIKEYREKNGAKWISGGFFSEANFLEEIGIHKNFLDDISSDVPLIISRFDTHSAFANSKTLEISGILESADNFTSDEIIKDSDGNFTGELKERARDFVLDNIPAASLEERTLVVIEQIRKMHSLGIAAVSDISLVDDLEIYKDLIRQKKLFLRVDARLPFKEFYNLKKYRTEFSEITDKIKFQSLKAFYDGSLSSRTALMHSNYRSSSQNGIKTEFVNSGEFKKMAFEIDEDGIQMSVHAIGDKAVTELLDLNQELITKNGKRDRRFRIEHAQHIRKNDFPRFKDLEVIASVQPAHLFSDAKTASEILDDYSIEHNYKKLFDFGAGVCFGTDFPIVGVSPFENIYYAMTRKALGFENGFLTENNFSLIECLEAYTINNAYASYDEKERGSLDPGKAADIIVMDNNLFEMTGDEIRDAKVNETYFAGVKVF